MTVASHGPGGDAGKAGVRPPIDRGTILITGASSGIGREIARQLAHRAGRLVLVARRKDRLEELRGELLRAHPGLSIRVEPCDLSDKSAVETMLATLEGEVVPIDVLVSNAGLGDLALYDRAEWSHIERMLQVNMLAPALLTHRLLPGMIRRGRGGVLNLGSGAGFALMPGSAGYVGTKHFVDGFTETLRAELEGTGVVVTQVCPGPVGTEFDEAAGIGGLVGGPPKFVRISAEQCAREAIAGFESGRALVFPGLAFRLSMGVLALIPRRVQRVAARRSARRLRGWANGQD